jgi:hypothetical protein
MILPSYAWKDEIVVIHEFSGHLNDVLDVSDGHLHLTQGKSPRNKTDVITTQPIPLTNHLESLINHRATAFFESLRGSEINRDHYEQVVTFKREVKTLIQCLKDLQKSFNTLGDRIPETRCLALCERAKDFYKKVKTYKSTLQKPPLAERPVKHFVYNERTDIRSIGWKHPKRRPIEDTVKAAKDALAFSEKQRAQHLEKKGGIACFFSNISNFYGIMEAVAKAPESEKEKVRTTHVKKFVDDIFTEEPVDMHWEAYQQIVSQLMHTPVITDEFVNAFKNLANHAESLNLLTATLASNDIAELAPFLEQVVGISPLTPSEFIEKMKPIYQEKKFQLITLHSLKNHYELIRDLSEGEHETNPFFRSNRDAFIQRHSRHLKDDAKSARPGGPFISPTRLIELLNAAFASQSCREIRLLPSIAKHPSISTLLKKHSFEQMFPGKYIKY